MYKRAIICGGSIAGLSAATELLRRGWAVGVYEAANQMPCERGPDLFGDQLLFGILSQLGLESASIHRRVAIDMDGLPVEEIASTDQVFDRSEIFQALRSQLPEDILRPGRRLRAYTTSSDEVTVRFDDGSEETADLLIGADGYRSNVRSQMFPGVAPEYSGYVAWYARAPRTNVTIDPRDQLEDCGGFFLPTGSHALVYPTCAGDALDLVWYTRVAATDLDRDLRDNAGARRALAPGSIRDDVLLRMRRQAGQILARPLRDLLDRAEQPWFQPIYDHISPNFGSGMVALVGDAAAMARPHVGSGVTRALEDVAELVRQIGEGDDIPGAIARYSRVRQPVAKLAVARGRHLGAMLFATPLGADDPQGHHAPNLRYVLETTATPVISE